VDETFGSDKRIKSPAAFRRVFDKALPASSAHLVVYAMPKNEGPPRLGIAVGRKVGGAVVRNGIKRRLRATFRIAVRGLPCADIVVVARPPVVQLTYQGLEEMLKRLVLESINRSSPGNGMQ